MKYTINYTHEDEIYILRKMFLEAFLHDHLEKHPDVKESLEVKFKQLVKEEGV